MSMKLTIITVLICASFFSTGSAVAGCTKKDEREMKDSGMSEARIRRICNNPDVNSGDNEEEPTQQRRQRAQIVPMEQQTVTNFCQTPVMWCTLFQQGPPRTPCWCNSPYGPVSGFLISR